MLTGLSHDTIGSSNNKDSTIHLCSAGDHVLDIVSVARAVNVCIVSLRSLILDVCRGDRYTTSLLFRCLIDLIERNCRIKSESCSKNSGDSCSQSSFAVVNMADGTNVDMRFGSIKMSLSHCLKPPSNVK